MGEFRKPIDMGTPTHEKGTDTVHRRFSNSITMINAIDVGSLDYVIRVRVFQKSEKTRYRAVEKRGQFFSFDVCDEKGEIRITVFDKLCDKYFDLIEVGTIYLLKDGKVQPKHKFYNILRHSCEIRITSQTKIQKLPNEIDRRIPILHHSPITLADAQLKRVDTFIDVLVVAIDGNKIAHRPSSKTGALMKMRFVEVLDKSLKKMTLLVQGTLADQRFDRLEVLLLKNVRVLNFEGKICLYVVYLKTAVIINPNSTEAQALREWAVIKLNEEV